MVVDIEELGRVWEIIESITAALQCSETQRAWGWILTTNCAGELRIACGYDLVYVYNEWVTLSFINFIVKTVSNLLFYKTIPMVLRCLVTYLLNFKMCPIIYDHTV